MRAIGAFALAALLGGCTTTRVMQRDGCWVRQTKRTLGGTTEELGPCMRPPPAWAEDRLTRLVQECVAQADHRWTERAIDAWTRRVPPPAQEPQRDVVRACMEGAASDVAARTEALRERLAEVSTDRAALAAKDAETEAHLRASHDRLAEFLGEAARRPPPVATATATATSDGTATTDNGLTSETGTSSQALPAAAPVLPVAAASGAAGPAAVRPPPAPAAQRGRARREPAAPACPVPRGATTSAGPEAPAPAPGEAVPR